MTLAAEARGQTVTGAVPSLKRRLLCFVYEGVLLFGVVMFAGLIYGLVTQQRHALVGSTGLKAFLFVVLGLYFVFFWCRSGQTLAMLTWRILLVGPDGGRVTRWRALARYVLSWLWFMPALALVYFSGLKGAGVASVVLVVGVLAYAGLAWLRSDRQFWHDAVCKTRLLSAPPPAKRVKKDKP